MPVSPPSSVPLPSATWSRALSAPREWTRLCSLRAYRPVWSPAELPCSNFPLLQQVYRRYLGHK